MKQPTINQKREAIAMHRGGLGELNDAQVEIVWTSLDVETQEKYLGALEAQKKSVKGGPQPHVKGKKDARSNRSTTKNPDSPQD